MALENAEWTSKENDLAVLIFVFSETKIGQEGLRLGEGRLEMIENDEKQKIDQPTISTLKAKKRDAMWNSRQQDTDI